VAHPLHIDFKHQLIPTFSEELAWDELRVGFLKEQLAIKPNAL
jgi:hypothetical protein